MRIVIKPDALEEVFQTADISTLMQLYDCKLGVTPQILDEYHAKLSQNSNYISWFNAIQGSNKFESLSTPLINHYKSAVNTLNSSYVVTSYCHSHCLVVNNAFAASQSEQAEIVDYGISAIKINNLQAEKDSKDFGIKPFLTYYLRSNTHFGLSILSNYFHKEKSVFFYDKYVTNYTLHCIEELCRLIDDQATIRVMTTNLSASCKTVPQIQAALTAIKPNANIFVCLADTPTRQEMHDRYIFLGERIQITLTRGLDAFGLSSVIPNVNKTCDITLFWIGASNKVSFVDTSNNIIEVNMIA